MLMEKRIKKLENITNDELPSLVALIQQGVEKQLWNQVAVDYINLEDLARQAFNLVHSISIKDRQ